MRRMNLEWIKKGIFCSFLNLWCGKLWRKEGISSDKIFHFIFLATILDWIFAICLLVQLHHWGFKIHAEPKNIVKTVQTTSLLVLFFPSQIIFFIRHKRKLRMYTFYCCLSKYRYAHRYVLIIDYKRHHRNEQKKVWKINEIKIHLFKSIHSIFHRKSKWGGGGVGG